MGENSCVRLSLIVVNVIFLLFGLALLGLGIWVQVEKGDYIAIANSDTGLTGAILLIVIGAFTIVFSLVGIIGAATRKRWLLWLFFSVLAILVVLEVVALIFGFIYRDKVEDELHDDMKKTIHEYDTDVEGVTKAWDWAQQKFECCGVDNSSNWRDSSTEFNKAGNHQFVPDSCCKDEKEGCGDFIRKPKNEFQSKIYQKGCFGELRTFIKNHLLTIGLSALAILFVELIVIILTLVFVIRLGPGTSKVV